jgi:SNF2 family DNA or RNA helicase
MIERALQFDSSDIIQSVRIDGKVQPKNRSHAIQQLHDNPSIRVILVTVACGACGWVHAENTCRLMASLTSISV